MSNEINILQLNVWMGKVEGNLRRFFRNNNFDIICLQEVMYSSDAEKHLGRLCFDAHQIIESSGMPYHFFSPNWRSKMANGHVEVGNMILSKSPFISQHSEFVHGRYVPDMILGKDAISGNINVQIAKLASGLTVINHHGFWYPSPVGDDESLVAFRRLAKIIKPYAASEPLVLCGDLNLIHDAPAMRSLDFLEDLTDTHGVKNTLTGLKFDGEVACDHIMINSQVALSKFIVHDALVSDHCALSAKIKLHSSLEPSA